MLAYIWWVYYVKVLGQYTSLINPIILELLLRWRIGENLKNPTKHPNIVSGRKTCLGNLRWNTLPKN